MYTELINKIKEYDKIIIHRHSRPDGDAIGSQVGLKHVITSSWPEKKVLMVGDPAGRYDFIEDSVMDEVADSEYADALAIVLDTSAPHLISDDRYTIAKENARMDHHLFIEPICGTEVVDSSYESCCSVITAMVRECHLQVDEVGARALFTGMVTDSGRFRFDQTTDKTFMNAAFLYEKGNIDFNVLYKNLYAEDFESVKRKAEFILKIQFTENKVAYIYNTLAEVEATGLSTFAVSRGMVGTMADIKGVDIWVNFTEEKDEEGKIHVLCELRSSKYNINPVAVKYGGGGHEKASGATVADRETAMAMLSDLDAMMI